MFDVVVDTSKADVRLEKMPEEVRDALIVAVTLAAGEFRMVRTGACRRSANSISWRQCIALRRHVFDDHY